MIRYIFSLSFFGGAVSYIYIFFLSYIWVHSGMFLMDCWWSLTLDKTSLWAISSRLLWPRVRCCKAALGPSIVSMSGWGGGWIHMTVCVSTIHDSLIKFSKDKADINIFFLLSTETEPSLAPVFPSLASWFLLHFSPFIRSSSCD